MHETPGSISGRDGARHGDVGVGRESRGASWPQGPRSTDEEGCMRTDELITMLATSSGAVESGSALKRVAMAIGWGAFGAALLMAVMLGVRPDLGQAVSRPMFWVKIAYAITLLLAS